MQLPKVIHVLTMAKVIIRRRIVIKSMVIIPISLLTEKEEGVEVLVEEILYVEVITMVKCAHIMELMDTQLRNVIGNMDIHLGTSYTRLKMIRSIML